MSETIEFEVFTEDDIREMARDEAECYVNDMDTDWIKDEIMVDLDIGHEVAGAIQSMPMPSCVEDLIRSEVEAQIDNVVDYKFTDEEVTILRAVVALLQKHFKREVVDGSE